MDNRTAAAQGGDYEAFLASKQVHAPATGFDCGPVNAAAKPFQADIVRWALKRGRAAIFADTGLGKTFMQLEWARHVAENHGKVLILAPLAVAAQTVREAAKFGVHGVAHVHAPSGDMIQVTNYEKLHKFNPADYAGVVLDESSILKSYMGKTKRAIIDAFKGTRFKLACTATPAPNDHLELGNHAEFLEVMDSNEMISRWFLNDTMKAGGYRLKKHAAKDFWRWVASWAVSVTMPSDLGYSDDGYILPKLTIESHTVAVDITSDTGGRLMRVPDMSSTAIHRELKRTTADRAAKVAEIVAAPGQWLVWCYSDYEADALLKAIPEALDIRGSQTEAAREATLNDFTDGRLRVFISKPQLSGFGMNWQHCNQVAFVGLSYSFESYYQAIRRVWRFGQQRPVICHIVQAETEGALVATIESKEKEFRAMRQEMTAAMRDESVRQLRNDALVLTLPDEERRGENWTLYHADCVSKARQLPSDSVGLSVFSPPFSNLYIYSDSIADMGNTEDDEEFMEQFQFLIRELHRITIPGRNCAVHCKDLPLYRGRDGAAGLRDFPGHIIRAFEAEGWTFHSRVTIWKDPVIEMQRTKNHGLLYKQLCADSAASRQGMADYIITFRKWTPDAEFSDPVHGDGERFDEYKGLEPPDAAMVAYDAGVPVPAQVGGKWPRFNPFQKGSEAARLWSIMVWQKYASPVWFDINQTDVLNKDLARDSDDERHICPLQLDVIERCIHLWSNPGDVIFSPFTGIGSEGFVALKCGRQFIGTELKRGYFEIAEKNLMRAAGEDSMQVSLWQ
jgi:DNA modification methylase